MLNCPGIRVLGFLQPWGSLFVSDCSGVHLKDEQDEEQHQDDLNADDKQLREEVSQHRLHGAHT